MGEWRKSHSEELHNLYSSPDNIRQVKSRQMRWVGHVACMGKERKLYKERKETTQKTKAMDLGEIGFGGCGLD
jgi:hypothetical protein